MEMISQHSCWKRLVSWSVSYRIKLNCWDLFSYLCVVLSAGRRRCHTPFQNSALCCAPTNNKPSSVYLMCPLPPAQPRSTTIYYTYYELYNSYPLPCITCWNFFRYLRCLYRRLRSKLTFIYESVY